MDLISTSTKATAEAKQMRGNYVASVSIDGTTVTLGGKFSIDTLSNETPEMAVHRAVLALIRVDVKAVKISEETSEQ